MKTQIVHFRKAEANRTSCLFKCGKNNIDVVQKYKYLGCIFNEHLDFTTTANVLAEAASRALGSVINKCLKHNSIMYNSYTKVYNSGISSIMDYASGVWGYKNYDKPKVIQNRAQRAFLGVHRFTSNVVVNGHMGWTSPVVRRKMNILRLWNRLEKMSDTRLTKRIYLWDKSQNRNNWSRDCKKVLKEIGEF